MSGAGDGRGPLVERADELAALDDALEAARAGRGATALVEGPPGIGKTALLGAATARARERGMRVLAARAGALEQTHAYAVVRQLFEPVLDAAGEQARERLLAGAAGQARHVVDRRAGPARYPVEPAAVLHGLYWLTADLALERPLALVVDDAHWSDESSMSWLAYLARRIDGLSVALIAGARPAEPGAGETRLHALRAVDGLLRIEPAPLSLAGVDVVARAVLGEQVEEPFSAACRLATGGNPFYLVELLRALDLDGATGTAASAEAIDRLTPRAVVDATLARLRRMPGEALRVAEAAALLEPAAELRWIAELTGLRLDEVAATADAMLAAGMLRSALPCRFEHPILRAAVESEIAPARRGLMHLKAAGAFAKAGMPSDAVAGHLMLAPPCGAPWVVDALRQAAREAGARGAPAGAVAYLERALAERPPRSERRKLLLELGRAATRDRRRGAADHLREALALAETPDEEAGAALALGNALLDAGAVDECYAVVGATVAKLAGRESRAVVELQANLLRLAGPAGRMAETATLAAAMEARTPPGSPLAGSVQASLALRDLVSGRPRARVRERAELGLGEVLRGLESGSGGLGREVPGMAFLWIDDLDRAEQLFADAIAAASRLGRKAMFENFSALRGYTRRQRGQLADAAADIDPVLAAAGQGERPGMGTLLALITQVLLLVDHGQPAMAEVLAGLAPIPAAFERSPFVAMLRHAQGTAQLAQHKVAEAAVTLTRVGEVCDASGVLSPAMVPWRSQLALALAGTDRDGEALGLALAELHLAERCDVDRARGVALRALGLVEGGAAGLRRHEAAIDALERSPARLELGWACYELGAALRRANRRREARAPLDRALDLALVCGGEALAGRAREDLRALGARSRRIPLSGAAALTPSERRVCRLGAEGLMNREIARALFLSIKTVEMHLGNAYRKLGISTRAELEQALAPGELSPGAPPS